MSCLSLCYKRRIAAQSQVALLSTKTKKGIAMILRLSAAFLIFLLSSVSLADARILPMQERAAVIDRWLTHRVQTVLPDLMRREGIDMWVIIS
ncbi:MAG: hypothetical protein ACI88G_001863, partial [Woeseiaceae bacterium]